MKHQNNTVNPSKSDSYANSSSGNSHVNMDIAIATTPQKLLEKRLSSHDTLLWEAVRQGNISNTRYFLEKFAQFYQQLQPSAGSTVFKDMFVLPARGNQQSTPLYTLTQNEEILKLLDMYGVNFFAGVSPGYSAEVFQAQLKDKAVPVIVYQNEAYWKMLLGERLHARAELNISVRLMAQMYLKTLDQGQGSQKRVAKQFHDQQLLNLGHYLNNEKELLEGLNEKHVNSFTNRHVRRAIRSAVAADLRDENPNTRRRLGLETLTFAGCLVGFVFWCIYNNQIRTERDALSQECKGQEGYDECMRHPVDYGYYSGEVNTTFIGAGDCLIHPSKFDSYCSAQPFFDTYEQCYDKSIIMIFQTLALIIVGFMMIVRPEDDREISVRLSMIQELVKSPVYLANYFVGELKPLTQISQKQERVNVYKSLLELFLQEYTEGEHHESLSAQLEILDKPTQEITADELIAVVETLNTVLTPYILENAQGIAGVNIQTLHVLLERFSTIMSVDSRDVERASRMVSNPIRFSQLSVNQSPTEETGLLRKNNSNTNNRATHQ